MQQTSDHLGFQVAVDIPGEELLAGCDITQEVKFQRMLQTQLHNNASGDAVETNEEDEAEYHSHLSTDDSNSASNMSQPSSSRIRNPNPFQCKRRGQKRKTGLCLTDRNWKSHSRERSAQSSSGFNLMDSRAEEDY